MNTLVTDCKHDGAGNGTRTRDVALEGRSVTITLFLRMVLKTGFEPARRVADAPKASVYAVSPLEQKCGSGFSTPRGRPQQIPTDFLAYCSKSSCTYKSTGS